MKKIGLKDFLVIVFLLLPLSAFSNVVSWGENQNGNLANGTNTDSNVPVSVITSGALAGKQVVQVTSASSQGGCALTTEGRVYCWGLGSSGELGNGSAFTSFVPVAVSTSGELSGKVVTAITSGAASRCALTTEGRVYCWGDNSSGQLGDSDGGNDSAVPAAVTGALTTKTVTAISCGGLFCLALTSEGKVYSWGENGSGQLGNNDGTNTDLDVSAAVLDSGVLSGKTVVAIAAASETGYALTSDGNVYSWGESDAGQLGDNNIGGPDAIAPVAVYTGGLLSGKTVTKISAGGDSGYALTSDGGIFSWGENGVGNLGNNDFNDSWAPVSVYTAGVLSGKTITSIVAGGSGAYALSSLGEVFSWGQGSSGQLGNGGALIPSNVPVAVSTAGVLSGKTIASLGASSQSAYAVLQEVAPLPLPTDPNLVSWGENQNGNLGNGTNTDSNIPVSVITSGALAGKQVVQVTSASSQGGCALTTEGRVYCWGLGSSGELGNGETSTYFVPVAVSTSGELNGKVVTAITSGLASRCALTTEGRVYCWGDNSSGQLGDNNGGNDSTVPRAVNGVLTGKTVTAISCGGFFCLALTSEGKVYSWGENGSGQLGNNDGTNTDLDVPAAVLDSGVLSGKTVVAIAAASETGYALTSDGNVYSWGESDAGQLGDNNIGGPDAIAPVAVYTGGLLSGKTVTKISAGGDSGYALTSDGGIFSWGENGVGNLGNNDFNDSWAPVSVYTAGVLSGKTITSIVAGGSGAYVLSSLGEVFSWGQGSSGQLGNGGALVASNVPVAVSTAGVLSGKRIASIGTSSQSAYAVLQISAPGQPENVQTTPGFQSVTVSWSVPLTGGTPASYTVTAYLGGVSTGQTCTVNYPAVSCAVTGLTNGQFYTFVVAAENAGGTTPANATAAVQPAQSAGIPTLSEWAQILLVLSMIGMTGWYSRRRYS